MNSPDVARSRRNLLITAALFSTGGVAIKSVQMTGASIACFRSGIATLTLFLLLPGARRFRDARVYFFALAYACTLSLFVIANKLTTGANAIFLEDAAPLYIVLLSAIFLHERPTRADFWSMLPIAGGLALFFAGTEPSFKTAPNPRLGNLIAAACGIAYAIVIVGFRALSRKGDTGASAAVAAVGNALTFLLCLPFASIDSFGSLQDWTILLYLGVIQIGLAYWLMTAALRHISAIEASLLLLLEPVLNPIWIWLAYREHPSRFALVGGALILGATAFRTLSSAREPSSIQTAVGNS